MLLIRGSTVSAWSLGAWGLGFKAFRCRILDLEANVSVAGSPVKYASLFSSKNSTGQVREL